MLQVFADVTDVTALAQKPVENMSLFRENVGRLHTCRNLSSLSKLNL